MLKIEIERVRAQARTHAPCSLISYRLLRLMWLPFFFHRWMVFFVVAILSFVVCISHQPSYMGLN